MISRYRSFVDIGHDIGHDIEGHASACARAKNHNKICALQSVFDTEPTVNSLQSWVAKLPQSPLSPSPPPPPSRPTSPAFALSRLSATAAVCFGTAGLNVLNHTVNRKHGFLERLATRVQTPETLFNSHSPYLACTPWSQTYTMPWSRLRQPTTPS
jgi:hypothetical protein